MDLTVNKTEALLQAHPNLKDCLGKVALQRGPIVYGFEGLDNSGATNLVLAATRALTPEYRNVLGGITVIQGKRADGEPFTAIPFYAFANRGKSSQEVWVGLKDLKRNEEWWEGKLYRPLKQ